ncbi:MAG: Hsp70 family protein [Deltaproteobacteria bacterium]|nr:Hsp70 family protein [Deltaproteobacteria bacterium]
MSGLGIDFGTTNSSVVFYDGREFVDVVGVMPTALYLDREFGSSVGQEAVDAYLRENTGRLVQLEAEDLGEIEFTIAGGDEIQGSKQDGGAITHIARVHAFTDRHLPGRLFRSVKRWLGDSALDSVRVFERRYRIVALVTPILVHLQQQAAKLGAADVPLYVGRPVRYEGRREDATRTAVRRMREACSHAGMTDAELYPEPVAAAVSFLHGQAPQPGRIVLAFDFGGGTLDLTVVREVVREGRDDFEILATCGRGIGGDVIDQALYRAFVFPEVGEGAIFHRPIGPELREFEFPFRDFSERLLNWTLAYELNRPDLRAVILEAMREKGETGRRLERLWELVTRNHAYRVFQAVERAKVQLSDRECAAIDVPELGLRRELRRTELEEAISGLLDQVGACVDLAVERSGVPAREIGMVARTGGSSRIPAVIRLLEERFPGRVVEHAPFSSIAAGLALAAHARRETSGTG